MSEKVQVEEKETVVKRRTQLPKLLVNQIKLEYLTGQFSIRDLAIKYGLSQRALEVRCSREGWRDQGEKIIQKTVQIVKEREESRLDMLHAHEDRMISRMQKRLETVDKTFSQIGELVEPQDLKSLVGTEATIDAVIRRNLGAEEKLDVTSGGKSLEEAIVSVLHKVRNALAADSSRVIEVEPLKLAADKFRQ